MFRDLLNRCGLTIKTASIILGVPRHTIHNWIYKPDRYNVPDDVIGKLEAYAAQADKIFDKGK